MSATRPALDRPAPDRRALLGGSLALASAVVASAAPTIAETAAHPDAELLRLAHVMEATSQRMEELSSRSWELQETVFQEPPVPEALYWRAGDHERVGFSMEYLRRCTVDGQKRYSYVPFGLDKLRKALTGHEAHHIDRSSYGSERMTRLRELVDAGEAWHAERDAAYEAAGCAALDRLYDRESDNKEALARQIAALPARTPEGVCAKVRAITAADCWNVEALEDGFAKRIADADHDELAEVLLMSALIDAAKFAPPPAAASATKAA